MTAAWVVLTALAVGYLLGRWRPWPRLASWADWRMRDDGRWWSCRRRPVVAAWLITRPRGSWRAWRHRHDPPPQRGPAMTFDTDLTRRRTERP